MTTIAELIASVVFKVDEKQLVDLEKKLDAAERKLTASEKRAQLRGKLIADNTAANLKAAAASAKAHTEAWDKIGGSIAKVGTTLLGVGAGFAALVSNGAAAAGSVNNAAKAAQLSAEEYQRLQYAFEATGGTTEQMSDAFRTLAKNLSDARKGSATATEAFENLGINAREFGHLGVEDQFHALADGFKNLHDPAARATTAMQLFGGQGDQLLQAFEGGADGLAALGVEAESLGKVMSNEAVKSAAAFDTELGKIKTELGALVRDLGIKAIPILRDMIRNWDRWAVAVGALGVAFAAAKLAALPGQLGLAASSMTTLAARTAGATAAALALGVALGTALDNALGISDALAGVEGTRGKRGAGSFLGEFTSEEESKLQAAQAKITDLETHGGAYLKTSKGLAELEGARRQYFEIEGAAKKRAAAREKAKNDAANKALGEAEVGLKKSSDELIAFKAGEAALAGVDKFAKKETARAAAERKAKRGAGAGQAKARAVAAKKKQFEDQANELFGDELRRLARNAGVGEGAVASAVAAAGSSLSEFSTQDVARQAGLSRLGGLTGQNLTTSSSDPLISELLGTDVPDVELSAIARGAEPQTLISTINNHFTFDNDFAIDGAGSPEAVARETATQLRDAFQGALEESTKTAKVKFAR